MPLQKFLAKHSLSLGEKIAKGYSAEIFLCARADGARFVLKCEKAKSTRRDMVRKETDFLQQSNAVGIGPKLVAFDLEARCILMEFIVGERFSDWIAVSRTKKELTFFFSDLFLQLKKLDEIGLDHGQLGGCGRNILVRNGLPVIIDFEKASIVRKCHNLSQVLGEFFYSKHSAIRKKILTEFGGEKELELFLKKRVGKIQGIIP